MKTKASTLIITPTYKEEDNLSELTQKLWKTCPEAHILIVNDESGDQTPQWTQNHPAYQDQLFLLQRPSKQGLGTAYLDGFRWGLQQMHFYDFFVQMDADLQHDPEDIIELQQAAAQGADLVLASRYLHGVRVLNWPVRRLILSIGAAQYVALLTRMPFTDPTSGYKLWKRHILEELDLNAVQSNGYAFQIEMTHLAWRKGFIIQEVPIIFEGRHAGKSKMSAPIAREAFWQVLRLACQRQKKK